jgi:BolA protein
MNTNQQRIQIIQQRLRQALDPSFLEVIDESHLHAGHPGAATGMGHFFICIGSAHFSNKNLVETHRLIYSALDDLMKTDIHALRIKINAL